MVTRLRTIVAVATLAGCFSWAPPGWAAVKCIDDAGDAAQIAAARTAIDAACGCFGFPSRGLYRACVSGIVNDRVDMSLLRGPCKGTVKKIYTKSVCGLEQPNVPCIRKSPSDRVSCAVKPIRPFGSSYPACSSSGGTQRDLCLAHTHCLDAADTNGDLEIASPGDSGSCTALPSTFTDNGDGTITDSRTRLTWEKFSDDGSIHDKNNDYVWSDAFAVKIAALNASGGFAGHTDWRVPTINELLTLYRPLFPHLPPEFDTACAPGCTVLTCSCVEGGWSSTRNALDAQEAWHFSSIGVGSLHKFNQLPVRGVRGGP
jgi:hypothetical protein